MCDNRVALWKITPCQLSRVADACILLFGQGKGGRTDEDQRLRDHPLPERLFAQRCRQVLRERNRVIRSGDKDAVHDLRVATRRLEEALRFFAPGLPSHPRKRLARRARRIRRSLAQVRNVDVLIELTRQAGQHLTPEQRQRLVPLARRLASQARALRLAGRERTGLRVPGIRKRVVALHERLRFTPDFPFRQRGRQILDERLDELGDAIPAARTGVPAALHTLRLAIKRYRYTLEILGQSGFRKARAAATAARDIQMVLGELHDLDVLIDLVRTAGPSSTRALLAPLRKQRRLRLGRTLAALDAFRPHKAVRLLNGIPRGRAAA